MGVSFSRRPAADMHLRVSFEFFPPANDRLAAMLWETLSRLAPLRPDFVSVTYGAGGSTRERTLSTVARIARETSVPVAGHLTCVEATRDAVNAVIDDYANAGLTRIVALRGDPSAGPNAPYKPFPGGYENAADLAGAISKRGGFDIFVAAYPEKHPQSPDFATDIEMLKRKVEAGATRAMTQFFYDNDVYEAYVERVRRAGIYIPVVPGILPVHDFAKVAHFAQRCGAHVPAWLAERFEGLETDSQTRALVASAIAAEQVNDLIERGVRDFHFYTMNRADLAYAICHLLGLRPQADKSSDEGLREAS